MKSLAEYGKNFVGVVAITILIALLLTRVGCCQKTIAFEGLKVRIPSGVSYKISMLKSGPNYRLATLTAKTTIAGEKAVIEINVGDYDGHNAEEYLKNTANATRSVLTDPQLTPGGGGENAYSSSMTAFLGMPACRQEYWVIHSTTKQKMLVHSLTSIGNRRIYMMSCTCPAKIDREASKVWRKFLKDISTN